MTILIGGLLAVVIAYLWGGAKRLESASQHTGRFARRRRARADPIDEAMVIDLAAAVIRSGAPIPAMLESVGSSLSDSEESTSMIRAGRALLIGATWDDAWEDAGPELDRLANALEPSWNDGAPPADLLARAAQGIRARRHRDAQTAAARLGAKLIIPLGLCFLPAFFLIGVVPVVASLSLMIFG